MALSILSVTTSKAMSSLFQVITDGERPDDAIRDRALGLMTHANIMNTTFGNQMARHAANWQYECFTERTER